MHAGVRANTLHVHHLSTLPGLGIHGLDDLGLDSLGLSLGLDSLGLDSLGALGLDGLGLDSLGALGLDALGLDGALDLDDFGLDSLGLDGLDDLLISLLLGLGDRQKTVIALLEAMTPVERYDLRTQLRGRDVPNPIIRLLHVQARKMNHCSGNFHLTHARLSSGATIWGLLSPLGDILITNMQRDGRF